MIMMAQKMNQPIIATHRTVSRKRHAKSTAYHLGDPCFCTCTNVRVCRKLIDIGTPLDTVVDIMDTSISRPSLSQNPLVLHSSALSMDAALPVSEKKTTEADSALVNWTVKSIMRIDLGTLMLKCCVFVHGCSDKKSSFVWLQTLPWKCASACEWSCRAPVIRCCMRLNMSCAESLFNIPSGKALLAWLE